MQPQDVTVSAFMLQGPYPFGTNLLFPLAVGAAAVMVPKSQMGAADVLDLCERRGATVLTMMPANLQQIIQLPPAELKRARDQLKTVTRVVSAGDALPASLYTKWMELFPQAELLDGLGTSELQHIFISNRIGRAKAGSLGQIVPGYNYRIVDPHGSQVPTGQTGSLHINGGACALFYFNRLEKSREVFLGNNWYSTGDQVHVDDDGYFWLHGRLDDMLKIEGKWCSPLEIEDILLQHPKIGDACVVSRQESGVSMGIAVGHTFAVVTGDTKPGDELRTELRSLIRANTEPWKAGGAEHIYFVDALPRNARGKLERKKLKNDRLRELFKSWA